MVVLAGLRQFFGAGGRFDSSHDHTVVLLLACMWWDEEAGCKLQSETAVKFWVVPNFGRRGVGNFIANGRDFSWQRILASGRTKRLVVSMRHGLASRYICTSSYRRELRGFGGASKDYHLIFRFLFFDT